MPRPETTLVYGRLLRLVSALLTKGGTMIKLEGARAPGVLRFLRPDVAGAIKLPRAGGPLIPFVLTLAFGDQPRQLARAWQKAPCTPRPPGSVRRPTFLAGGLLTPH